MKFLTFLPLIAAALALSLMLFSPLSVETRWGYGNHYQGRGYDRGDSRADYNHDATRRHNQKWSQNSFDTTPRQFYGARRDPSTGFWNPYR